MYAQNFVVVLTLLITNPAFICTLCKYYTPTKMLCQMLFCPLFIKLLFIFEYFVNILHNCIKYA